MRQRSTYISFDHLHKFARLMQETLKAQSLCHCTGELAKRVSSLRSSHYKCLAFNGPGTLLALGAEDGSLQVLEWPSLAIKFDNRSSLLSTLEVLHYSAVPRNLNLMKGI